MNKAQALHNFWSGFGITAYDETTVPDNAPFPYITYAVETDSLDNVVLMNASLWYKSYSWAEIQTKAEEIAEAIVKMQPPTIELDNGRLYIAKGTPFAQRMSEPSDDTVRRILLNISAEHRPADAD